MRIKGFFLILFIYSYLKPSAQSLLVNGSFEEINVCTEYQATCSPEGWISTGEAFKNYFKDPRGAQHGNYYMSIEAGKTNKYYNRSHIRSQLLCPLRGGNRYRLQFYIRSPHAIKDSVGIYFTTTDFLFEKTPAEKIKPTFYLSQFLKIKKGDSTWQQVTIDFTAKGIERFMTIGNFSKRDINGETRIPYINQFYVFFDNISLIPLNPYEKLCPGWTSAKERIYDFNERHEFLQRYVSYYRENPTVPVVTSQTRSITPPITMTPSRIDTLTVPDVLFAFSRSDLQKHAYMVLDSFCTMIRDKQIDSIIVEGHTDSTGNNLFNWQLSIERAGTVMRYLTGNCKVRNDLIFTRAWASERPVATNNSPFGRQLNRRVEILLYVRKR